jgi:hypothetical protein
LLTPGFGLACGLAWQAASLTVARHMGLQLFVEGRGLWLAAMGALQMPQAASNRNSSRPLGPQALIKGGADMEAKDKNGLTALQVRIKCLS